MGMTNPRQTPPFWSSDGALLVCVGPSPSSARVVRAAKRMAEAFNCPWIAVHVEHPEENTEDSERSADILKHAENLGAEPVTISGKDVIQSIIEYAHLRGATRIVIGKTGRGRISQLFRSSLVDRLLKESGDIDVFVVRGEGEPLTARKKTELPRLTFNRYTGTALTLVICTLVSKVFQWFGLADANIVMVFLSGVVFSAGRYGRWPGIASSLGSVVLFDVLFVEPYLTLSAHDTQYFIMFGVMLVIALFISDLTARIRQQADIAERHERRTDILYSLSRQLAATSGIDTLVKIIEHQLSSILAADVTVYLPATNGELPLAEKKAMDNRERETMQWAYHHKHPAGYGTDSGHDARGLYIPLQGADKTLGVIGIDFTGEEELSQERKQVLESCITQISVALERERLAEESRHALLQVEAEQWRNALLSSISHDLRTPLTGIAGTASALLSIETSDDKPERRDLLKNIASEANRLSRLVENLLSLVRIESDRAEIRKEWLPLEEVIGSALQALRQRLQERNVSTDLSADLPLVYIDGVLIEQAIINLLDNAVKFTRKDGTITLTARTSNTDLVVEVQDDGQGIPPDELPYIFNKFFSSGKKPSGSGLGLTITKAIIGSHEGHISADNNAAGGAYFKIVIPIGGQPPEFDDAFMETNPPS